MSGARALLCYVTAAAGAACNALRTRSANARAREPCSPCAAMETAVRVRLSTGRQIGRSSRFGQSDCGALRSSHLYRKDEEQARAQRSMEAYHRNDVVARRMNWADRFLFIVRKSRHHNSVYPRRGRVCPSLIVAEKKCSWPAQGGTAVTAKTRSRCGIAAKLFRSRRPVYTPAPARPIHPSSPNEERITWIGRRGDRERGKETQNQVPATSVYAAIPP